MTTQTQSLFASRSNEPELMDDPECEETALFTTLGHFKFINKLFSRTKTLAKKLLLPDMALGPKEFTLIDAGCGGGDQTICIAKLCRTRNIKCTVQGIDIDDRSIRFARQRWKSCSHVSFKTASIFDIPQDGSAADYIVLSNVLHHFNESEIPIVLHWLCNAARRGILIADLERSPVWYICFSLFAKAMLHGGFSQRDGLLSIRKGFTQRELFEFGQTLPSSWRVTTGKFFPGRLYLFCRKGM